MCVCVCVYIYIYMHSLVDLIDKLDHQNTSVNFITLASSKWLLGGETWKIQLSPTGSWDQDNING